MPLTHSIAYGESADLYISSDFFAMFYAVHRPEELIHTSGSDWQ